MNERVNDDLVFVFFFHILFLILARRQNVEDGCVKWQKKKLNRNANRTGWKKVTLNQEI